MPVLTDRREPEDFDNEPNSEDPNDYVIKYLFKRRNSPRLERERTGRTLLYSGVAANFLATSMLPVALEFRWPWPLLPIMGLMLLISGLLVYRVWTRQTIKGSFWLATLPVVLLIIGVANALTFGSADPNLILVFYYLPGAAVLLVAALLLLPRPSEITDED